MHIDEVSGLATIEGVATSTAAFIGESADADLGAATEVRSVAEFEAAYEGLPSSSELGVAVSQFFANGGSDAWVVGVPEGTSLVEGLASLDAVDVLNLVCLPGEADVEVLRAVLEYADRRRAFVVVDPRGANLEATIALAESLAAAGSANGAVYFPPVRVLNQAGGVTMCAPSGAVAGMYARVDRSVGVWKTPSGENAVLPAVVAPAVELDEDAIAKLRAGAVNPIRTSPSRGIRVWGARTLQGGEGSSSDWKYVPVRRLGLYIEESLYRGTQWAVFEPNDERLWGKLRRQCQLFLYVLFQAGAFPGRTADEAFLVRCGRDTMTQEDIDTGRLTILIGIAPVRPAEFVIIRISQWMAGSCRR